MSNTASFNKNCLDCAHCIQEPHQFLKCARKTEKLFTGQTVFAFCQDERHHEIGECGEEAKFFTPKKSTTRTMGVEIPRKGQSCGPSWIELEDKEPK